MKIKGFVIAATALAFSYATVAAAADNSMAAVCGDCVIEKVASCGGFLEGATTDASGRVWAVDLSGDRILEISDGRCISHGSAGGMPNGAKWRKDGTLLIAGSRGLLAFDPKANSIKTIADTFEGTPLSGLNDIAIDEVGGVYMTQPNGSSAVNPIGRLFYLPPGASEPMLLAANIPFPNGVAIGPNGQTVIVSEFAIRRVLSMPSVTAKGGIQLVHVYVTPNSGVGADGMLMDGKGRLFTANIGAGEIECFSPEQRSLGVIRLPDEAGRLVTNMTIAGGYLYVTEASKGEIWRVRLAS